MRSISFMILCLILSSMFLQLGCNRSQSAAAPANNQNRATQPLATPDSSAASPVLAGSAATPGTRIDPCSLLTAEEVKSVQGEAVKETKASEGSENGMSISQCFFSLPTFANSVNLAVMRKGEASKGRNPREFWEQTFGKSSEHEREKEREKSKERDRDEDEKGAGAQKVEGVGEEAFWTGNRVGGALYVLKHDSYIRVSIGGAGDQKTKIEKSKALARLALKRLS